MSHRALNEYQFEVKHWPHRGITALAKDGDRIVGQLHTHGSTGYDPDVGARTRAGEVGYLDVDPGHQRRGIATSLWQQAHDYAGKNDLAKPVHSKDRTADGDAWAQKVGGSLPKLKKRTY